MFDNSMLESSIVWYPKWVDHLRFKSPISFKIWLPRGLAAPSLSGPMFDNTWSCQKSFEFFFSPENEKFFFAAATSSFFPPEVKVDLAFVQNFSNHPSNPTSYSTYKNPKSNRKDPALYRFKAFVNKFLTIFISTAVSRG